MITNRLLPILVLILLASGQLRAQTTQDCTNYTTVAQMRKALTSDDADQKDEAVACGYKSQDKAVRGLVIRQLITGIKSLIFTLENSQGSAADLKALSVMPSFGADIAWHDDGRTFWGQGLNRSGLLKGQLLTEGLTIIFDNVQILKDAANPMSQTTSHSCSALLTVNPEKGRIDGPLRCTGMTSMFILVLGS